MEYICICQRANEAQCVPICVITEQVGDLKDTRDSQFCQVYRERMGVCLAWQLHPINCTALSKLHSNHLAQTETKMHCSDGGGDKDTERRETDGEWKEDRSKQVQNRQRNFRSNGQDLNIWLFVNSLHCLSI